MSPYSFGHKRSTCCCAICVNHPVSTIACFKLADIKRREQRGLDAAWRNDRHDAADEDSTAAVPRHCQSFIVHAPSLAHKLHAYFELKIVQLGIIVQCISAELISAPIKNAGFYCEASGMCCCCFHRSCISNVNSLSFCYGASPQAGTSVASTAAYLICVADISPASCPCSVPVRARTDYEPIDNAS